MEAVQISNKSVLDGWLRLKHELCRPCKSLKMADDKASLGGYFRITNLARGPMTYGVYVQTGN
jgi:hypothetical protein